MLATWHPIAAACYFAASVCAAVGIGMRSRRWLRLAVVAMAVGAAVHAVALYGLHALPVPPALTALPFAASLMAWAAVLFYLLFLPRVRGGALAVVVAPAAFLGAFAASLANGAPAAAPEASPAWSHVHVLLASAGFAMLGLAASAGLLHLVHSRAIKSKRRDAARSALPSLEALDRLNTIALLTGFVLLTLGFLSGLLWVRATRGELWLGDVHGMATLAAWGVYAGLVAARFGARLGANQAALASAVGFALLVLAVLGVEAVG